MNWKKIKTAPKDGTIIMVCNNKKYDYPEAAHWSKYKGINGREAWRTVLMSNILSPTHWAKVPQSPTKIKTIKDTKYKVS